MFHLVITLQGILVEGYLVKKAVLTSVYFHIYQEKVNEQKISVLVGLIIGHPGISNKIKFDCALLSWLEWSGGRAAVRFAEYWS